MLKLTLRFGGSVGARAAHRILQEMHGFRRSTTDEPDKLKALLSIHLKELFKKRQASLAFSIKCSPPPSEEVFLESGF